MNQEDILPSEMIFTVKMPPRLGHVVTLKNSSDDMASPVLDYIHSFSQEDIDQEHILYVSSSIQVYGLFILFYHLDVTAYFFLLSNRIKANKNTVSKDLLVNISK